MTSIIRVSILLYSNQSQASLSHVTIWRNNRMGVIWSRIIFHGKSKYLAWVVSLRLFHFNYLYTWLEFLLSVYYTAHLRLVGLLDWSFFSPFIPRHFYTWNLTGVSSPRLFHVNSTHGICPEILHPVYSMSPPHLNLDWGFFSPFIPCHIYAWVLCLSFFSSFIPCRPSACRLSRLFMFVFFYSVTALLDYAISGLWLLHCSFYCARDVLSRI